MRCPCYYCLALFTLVPGSWFLDSAFYAYCAVLLGVEFGLKRKEGRVAGGMGDVRMQFVLRWLY